MTLWDSIRRVANAAHSSFEGLLQSLSPAQPPDDDDPCTLKTINQQVAFTIAVIGLGAKMAKADGVVTPDEIDAFGEVFEIPEGEERNVKRVFDLARRDVAGFEGYAKQIAKLFRQCPAVLEDLMDGLFHIAKADGVVHPKELEFLARVAGIFGFTEDQFERIKCNHMGCPKADPYAILGVDRSISVADLKRAYHRLVRENHPDALIARGVPAEFINMANAKLAVINTAYEQIMRGREAVPAAV